MSLCYDFEKWTTISLASVAISLTVGLVYNILTGLLMEITTKMMYKNGWMLLRKYSI
jgi:hypothetical protein